MAKCEEIKPALRKFRLEVDAAELGAIQRGLQLLFEHATVGPYGGKVDGRGHYQGSDVATSKSLLATLALS